MNRLVSLLAVLLLPLVALARPLLIPPKHLQMPPRLRQRRSEDRDQRPRHRDIVAQRRADVPDVGGSVVVDRLSTLKLRGEAA